MRDDPLAGFNFYLTLVDTSDPSAPLGGASYFVASFSECSGLDASVEVLEYKEGGVNDYVHKFPTRASFSNLTLKRGVLLDNDDLWNWHNDFVTGYGTRKDGLIFLMDESRQYSKVWQFKRGIPVKWVGPSLNGSQSNVAIESLEISHEGLSLGAA